MLYVTTRDQRDAYTAKKVLGEQRGPDGGFFLPFKHPEFNREMLQKMEKASFGQIVADILNLLFHTKLSSWDVDFAVGRYPVRTVKLNQRIVVAETWHNPEWKFDRMVRNISTLLQDKRVDQPGNWVTISVRIAVLFGIFAQLQILDTDDKTDVAVLSGDFSVPMSVWYARQWGLPVGNIICSCNENNNIWNLICHGYLRCDAVSIPTILPQADVAVPENLERLIHACGGAEEVGRFLNCVRSGRLYDVDERMLSKLRSGLYVSVVSTNRVETAIPSVFKTHGYLADPYTALVYSGLLDYRAKTGRTHRAVVLSETSCHDSAEYVSGLLGVSAVQLESIL